jgi:hypothetical protein
VDSDPKAASKAASILSGPPEAAIQASPPAAPPMASQARGSRSAGVTF